MFFTETGNGNASLWADFNSENQNFIRKLYGSGDSSVTDTSDTSENSEVTCFKASSRWLAKFKARHGIHKLMLFQKLQNDAAKKRSANLKQLSMNDFVL